MKLLIIFLWTLSANIAAEDKNISPLYNCFIENFTPVKETTKDCFSCLLEVRNSSETLLSPLTSYQGPDTGEPQTINILHSNFPSYNTQFLLGRREPDRCWRSRWVTGLYGGKPWDDDSSEVSRPRSGWTGGWPCKNIEKWSCLPSTDSTKRNNCCGEVPRCEHHKRNFFPFKTSSRNLVWSVLEFFTNVDNLNLMLLHYM